MGEQTTNSTSNKSIRILIVEDHAILRAGLRALLELEADIEMVGEAGGGPEVIRLTLDARPTLAIVDLVMPGESGLRTISEIRTACPDVHVLVLTAHCADEYISAALTAGAEGYVVKSASSAELLRAIRAVAAGHRYFSSQISGRLVSAYLRREHRSDEGYTRITPRERELLARIARGHSNKRLAALMCLSIKTVEKHRATLMRKLGVHNTAELTLFAVRSGAVPLTDVPSLEHQWSGERAEAAVGA